jgi:hypothetical protein
MNAHDEDHPDHLLNQLDAVMEAVHTRCRHCSLDVKVIPASGARFVLGLTHEPGCPEFIAL